MHVRKQLSDIVLVGISRGRYGELLHSGRVIQPDGHHRGWREFYVDPDDGVLKDPIWFWRDRGIIVFGPARANGRGAMRNDGSKDSYHRIARKLD